jgi:hypothetical protein
MQFHKAGSPVQYGIVPTHWNAMQLFARNKHYVLCIRGGKSASVPWIQQGFPAKPLDLKIKVDPVLGMLLARTQPDRENAWSKGFPVLAAIDGQRGGFVAKLSRETAFQGKQFKQSWAQIGLVIDPQAQLPITSDYDLAAVIDTQHPNYYTTYMSIAGAADRNNLTVQAVSAALNKAFGSPRILHGSQAQYDGSLANKDNEPILVFHPNGDVDCCEGLSKLETDLVLQKLFLRYFPDKAHLFNQ